MKMKVTGYFTVMFDLHFWMLMEKVSANSCCLYWNLNPFFFFLIIDLDNIVGEDIPAESQGDIALLSLIRW